MSIFPREYKTEPGFDDLGNRCQCSCHRTGAVHVIACCTPQCPQHLPFLKYTVIDPSSPYFGEAGSTRDTRDLHIDAATGEVTVDLVLHSDETLVCGLRMEQLKAEEC